MQALHRRYNRRPMMWPHIIPSRTCANARECTHELWIQLQALTWGTGTKGHVGKAEERSAPALSSSPGRPAAISTKPELLGEPTRSQNSLFPGSRNECWRRQGREAGARACACHLAGTCASAGPDAAVSASAPAAATTAAVGQAAGRATGATAAAAVVRAASATGSTRNHDTPFARPTRRRRESAY